MNTYKCQIPIFTSEFYEANNGMFDSLSFDDLLSSIERKITGFNDNPFSIEKQKSNKTRKSGIDNITFSKHYLGKQPVLLVKFNYFDTNLNDVYVQTSKMIELQAQDKIGSENNYFLLYPEIIGFGHEKKYRWLIFVYEDPNKDRYVVTSGTKIVLHKVLKISTCNLKSADLLEKMRKMQTIPEIAIRLFSTEYDENEIDIKFRSYLSKIKLKNQKDQVFSNIPFEDAEELINTVDREDYDTKEVKVTSGKNEFRIKKTKKDENSKIIEQAVEEMFNEFVIISEATL